MLPRANPDSVSSRARDRGHEQIGTLGSGNHFLEIQAVEEIFDEPVARAFGLSKDQIVVLIHSGSRGLGHQVCTDALDYMQRGMKKYGISVVDRQLACVPIHSEEGRAYLQAMAAAANFAFANRQMMTHRVRESCRRVLGTSEIRVVYDVCHNIAKRKPHIGGREARRSSSTAKVQHALSPLFTPLSRTIFDRWGNPCWFPAAWELRRMCWWGRTGQCRRPSAPHAMVPAVQ